MKYGFERLRGAGGIAVSCCHRGGAGAGRASARSMAAAATPARHCGSDFIELHNNWRSTRQPGRLVGAVRLAPPAPGRSRRWPASIAPAAITCQAGRRRQRAAPALPTPDATGTIAMAAGAGKVALVNGTDRTSRRLPDRQRRFRRFGTAANCAEGSAPTAALERHRGVCAPTAAAPTATTTRADFAAGAPDPRNSASTSTAPTAAVACSIADRPDRSQHAASGNRSPCADAAGRPGGVSFALRHAGHRDRLAATTSAPAATPTIAEAVSASSARRSLATDRGTTPMRQLQHVGADQRRSRDQHRQRPPLFQLLRRSATEGDSGISIAFT